MQIDWWTLALQTVNFAILVWLLHRFLYRPVLRLVDQRRAAVDKDFATAAEAAKQAEAERAAIAAERQSVEDQRGAVLKAAAVEAEKAAGQRREQAEAEARRLLEEARRGLAREREEAEVEARSGALDLGIAIAERLLDEIPEELRAEAWLERIEQHLSALPDEERAGLSAGLSVELPLRVVTAFALSAQARQTWQRRLRSALGTDLAMDFAEEAALIAGAELHFPNAILRFSWRNSLKTLRAEVSLHHPDQAEGTPR